MLATYLYLKRFLLARKIVNTSLVTEIKPFSIIFKKMSAYAKGYDGGTK